jgi:hypothetical protein
MKITTINYQKLFPIGAYMNERMGVEIQVGEGESAEEALKMAKWMVEKFHIDNNPHLYEGGNTSTIYKYLGTDKKDVGESVAETPEEKISSLASSLAFCKTVDELKSYRLVVYSKQGTPELQTLYETKYRELKK